MKLDPVLRHFGNGRIPQELLVTVAPGLYLYEPAARALFGLVRLAASEGIAVEIAKAYIPYDEQPYPKGTNIMGWGVCIEFADSPDLIQWLQGHSLVYSYRRIEGNIYGYSI